MTIRKTTPEDLPRMMEIVEIARRFMRANGNMTQWIGQYPNEEILMEDILLGESYCIETDKVHAIFTLLDREEPLYNTIYEGKWPGDAPYGTLHRVASDGEISGVVAKAVEFASQFHSVLRCDTHEDNLPMQNALKRAGFVQCGIIHLANGDPRLAFQRGK